MIMMMIIDDVPNYFTLSLGWTANAAVPMSRNLSLLVQHVFFILIECYVRFEISVSTEFVQNSTWRPCVVSIYLFHQALCKSPGAAAIQ